MKAHPAALLAVAASTALAACGDGSTDDLVIDPNTASLTYEYRDASVPPEYHRSYTLTLTGALSGGGAGELVVDSYGDVLHRAPLEVGLDEWESALVAVVELGLEGTEGEDCAGGTGRAVALDVDDESLVASSISDCGDDEAAARLDAAVAPLLAGVDLDTVLADGD